MRQVLLVAPCVVILPAAAAASTATYWYLGPQAGIPFTSQSTSQIFGSSPPVHRNQGRITFKAPADGVAGRTIGNPDWNDPDPFSATGGFTILNRMPGYSLTFDQNGEVADYDLSWILPGDVAYFFSMSPEAGDRITEICFAARCPSAPDDERILFDGDPGMWFRREADYVDAAREAGAVPIPPPAAGWLAAASFAVLAWLRQRIRPV